MRSEPSAGQRMWPTSGAAAQERRRREWGNKRGRGLGRWGGEQADQLSLLFVSLHYSESGTGAFSSPSLADPAGKGRSFHSAGERERPQRVRAQVAVRPVHVIHH